MALVLLLVDSQTAPRRPRSASRSITNSLAGQPWSPFPGRALAPRRLQRQGPPAAAQTELRGGTTPTYTATTTTLGTSGTATADSAAGSAQDGAANRISRNSVARPPFAPHDTTHTAYPHELHR